MPFDFATAARIVFGEGEARRLSEIAGPHGRALLVAGSQPDRVRPLVSKFSHSSLTVAHEPAIDDIGAGLEQARHEKCECIIAIGGGSVIDAGKAIAALMANGGEPLDYLEVIGRGQPLSKPSAPFFAVPTTAGSGAEVTRNAVLASPTHGVKASLRSAFLLPKAAIVDPELTASLSRTVTASTGLDALTQLVEPYVSCRANSMTDLYCIEGMRRASASLERAWQNGADREARAGMSWASLLGGLALANAGLGAVHAFAAAIGGKWNAPHGAICAAVLPHAMEINIEALRRRTPMNHALRRYDEIARILTRHPHAVAGDALMWIADLCDRLQIPPLSAYGIAATDLDDLAAKAVQTSSMKGNPIALTHDELLEIATRAL